MLRHQADPDCDGAAALLPHATVGAAGGNGPPGRSSSGGGAVPGTRPPGGATNASLGPLQQQQQRGYNSATGVSGGLVVVVLHLLREQHLTALLSWPLAFHGGRPGVAALVGAVSELLAAPLVGGAGVCGVVMCVVITSI